MTIAARATSALAFLAALAVLSRAEAQEAGAPIVVQGQIPLTEDRALQVVRRVAEPVDGQLARFHDRVCPFVSGFDTPYAALVAERIKRTALRVGADAGSEGCAANLFVVIVDDGPAFVRELTLTHPEMLAGLSRSRVDELASEEGAARSWSATMLTNSVGAGAGRPSASLGGGAVRSGFAGSSVTFGDVSVMRTYEASNINPSVQQAIHSAWVVIETEATLGKSLRQIADYAAMRGLAMVRPSQLDGSEDTILELFEPGSHAAPPELTPFDLAYLTSLYRAPARRWSRSQVHYMADAIARDAEQAAP